ncbi:hypothetical protein H1Q59_06730 [Holosporaceae bacterium 'Namur']|nr:hypothetical protein [Holosporaceae bacterium 'Namur']
MKGNKTLTNFSFNKEAERYSTDFRAFMKAPIIKEVLDYINTNPLLKQFEWIKESGDTIHQNKREC